MVIVIYGYNAALLMAPQSAGTEAGPTKTIAIPTNLFIRRAGLRAGLTMQGHYLIHRTPDFPLLYKKTPPPDIRQRGSMIH